MFSRQNGTLPYSVPTSHFFRKNDQKSANMLENRVNLWYNNYYIRILCRFRYRRRRYRKYGSDINWNVGVTL